MLNTVFNTDVRQALDHFRRSVDQMFDNFYGGYQNQNSTAGTNERTWTFSPMVESGWTGNHLTLRAILPGVAEKKLRLSVQNTKLVLEGERQAPEGFDKTACRQRAYGKFYAALPLPAGLDLDHVS